MAETTEEKYDRFTLWSRNVLDKFKDLSNEEIKAKLKETAHPFAVCMENIKSDFNISTMFRTANVFNAEGFYYVGNKKYDRRGHCGSYIYNSITWLSDYDKLKDLKSKYTIVGVDNTQGAKDLNNFKFTKNMMFLFGEEGCGLTKEALDLCDALIEIPQYGSIRSLNVGTASGIIMHEFVSKYNKGEVL